MNERQKLATGILSYLADIPEEKWCCHRLENQYGQSCAMGLLGERYDRSTLASKSARKLDALMAVNDAPEYLGQHPKERVTHFLCDVIEGKR